MIYLSVLLFSCFLFVLWFITVIFKWITSHKKDYYKHESGNDVKIKGTHIEFIIAVIGISYFLAIKFFDEDYVFASAVLFLLSIITISFCVFFYHNHYLTTKKLSDNKTSKFKKIRYVSGIIITINIFVIIILSILPYVLSLW